MATETLNHPVQANDGMTADTAPGQDAAQAESAAREAAPRTGATAPDIPAADVTARDSDMRDGNVRNGAFAQGGSSGVNVADTTEVAADARTQRFIDALHALESDVGDAQSLAALFAEDGVISNSALERTGTTVQGRQAIATFWTDYKATLGDAMSNFHHITAGEDSAGLFWTTLGASNYHGATLLVFNANGEIAFLRGYYDTRELQVEA